MQHHGIDNQATNQGPSKASVASNVKSHREDFATTSLTEKSWGQNWYKTLAVSGTCLAWNGNNTQVWHPYFCECMCPPCLIALLAAVVDSVNKHVGAFAHLSSMWSHPTHLYISLLHSIPLLSDTSQHVGRHRAAVLEGASSRLCLWVYADD